MPVKRKPRKAKKQALNTARVRRRPTISFPPDIHDALERIARDKKVSLSWVVRDAVDVYLAEKWPLFKKLG